MLYNRLNIFTDRAEAITLFEEIRSRDSHQDWPLLPILAFTSLGGGGKSTLLEYLRIKKCSVDGKPAIPYVYLDFNLATAPTNFLLILITMRDQLQRLVDGQGKHLRFPRFDLGALIALAALNRQDFSSIRPAAIRSKLTTGIHFMDSLPSVGSSLGGAIGHSIPYLSYVALILETLKSLGQIKSLKNVLSNFLDNLEDKAAWQWYRQHGSQTGIGVNDHAREALLRLEALNMSGKPEQDLFIRELLPAAFIADLFEALLSDPPHAWTPTANVVFFFDGFETLQHANEGTATLLLRALTTDYLKEHPPGPILLVLASRDRLPGADNVEQVSLEQTIQDEKELKDHARKIYRNWRSKIKFDKKHARLSDLYLVFPLQDFGKQDTREFLLSYGTQKKDSIFADNAALVETIEQVTGGHPLFLALAAAAVLEAKEHGGQLEANDFVEVLVPTEVVPEHSLEHVGDFLLKLFLRQLDEDERDDLIRCSAPRFLDEGILRAVLQLPSDKKARTRLNKYRRYTFLRISNETQVVFHPVVRDLLLKQMPPSQKPNSDYQNTHQCLRAYFHDSAATGDEQATIEEAYHALALGDQKPALQLGLTSRREKLTLWEHLMKAVAEAPVAFQPSDIEQQADAAFERVDLKDDLEDWVTALVLYQWLLSSFPVDSPKRAAIWFNIGVLYTYMQRGNQQANLQRAIDFYEEALKVYTHELFPERWATTNIYLGEAYCLLRGKDRRDTRQKGIECYKKAEQIYTEESFPLEWARIQNNLGEAHGDLPEEDLPANVEKAIDYYQAALRVRSRQNSPFDLAITQNNLGNAYSHRSKGNRLENATNAIHCYEEALTVHTEERYHLEWARAQNNLGNVYRQLPWGDKQEQQINLSKAIEYYQEALRVRTEERYPVDWATTQYNRGLTYTMMPWTGPQEQETNLDQATACLERALRIHTREDYPVEWARVQNALGNVYRSQSGREQKERAIAYYQAALEILTREATPLEWARVQHNMGLAYSLLRGKDREGEFKKAMECYDRALTVRKPQTFPEEYARTQEAMGNACIHMWGANRKARVDKAILHYQNALRIFTSLVSTPDIRKVRAELDYALKESRRMR
jgi:tetratricopeptide (TPR) repeat protein